MNFKGKTKRTIMKKYTENIGKVYKNAIFFPSYPLDNSDFMEAFESGIIDEKTNIVLIERDSDIAKKISDAIDSLNIKNAKVVNKSFHEIDFSKHFENNSIDYISFDICGNITLKVAAKLDEIKSLLSYDVRFPITLSASYRRSEIINNIIDCSIMSNTSVHFWSKKRMLHWFIDYLQDNEVNCINMFFASEEIATSIAYQLFLLNSVFNSWSNEDKSFFVADYKEIIFYKNNDVSKMSKPMASVQCNLKKIKMIHNSTVLKRYEKNKKKINIDNTEFNGIKCNSIKRAWKILHSVSYYSFYGRRKAKTQGVTMSKKSYAEILNVKSHNDLAKKMKSAGFKAWVTRLANQDNTTQSRVIAGIRRTLTVNKK